MSCIKYLLILSIVFLNATNGFAKIHFLPDMQANTNPFTKRKSDTPFTSPTCSSLGYYDAASRPAGMDCVVAARIYSQECYACSCPSAYLHSTCPSGSSPYGIACEGKYKTCVCPNTYKTSDYDCGTGKILDRAKSCIAYEGNLSTQYYACKDDPCYNLPTPSTCKGYCVPSDQCSGKCSECITNCETLVSRNFASKCSYGCASSSNQLSYCSSGYCKYGSSCYDPCATMVLRGQCSGYCVSSDICPNNCAECITDCTTLVSRNLATKCNYKCNPSSKQLSYCSTGYCTYGSSCCEACSNDYYVKGSDATVVLDMANSCTDCTRGTVYLAIGCAINYAQYSTHWCSTTPITNCSTLGYAKISSCAEGTIVRCPFDKTYAKCIVFLKGEYE